MGEIEFRVRSTVHRGKTIFKTMKSSYLYIITHSVHNNPKYKKTMPILVILSEENDPPGFLVPVSVPQQIVVLPNDRDIHIPIVFPITFLLQGSAPPPPPPPPRGNPPPTAGG